MIRNIPLSRLWIDKTELYEIKKVLDSGWLTQGPKNEQLETLISNYLEVKHVICTTSCTTALHLALLSLGISTGEILVSDYTFPATGHVVLYAGLKPVFVDVEYDTYAMDYKDLKRKITDNTKAIMVVHPFGQSANMDNIITIADEKNIPIIEDAACALGSKYNGKYCGTMGKIGCFSMHATKGVSSGGEGGILVTNDDDIAGLVRELRTFGQGSSWKRETDNNFTIPVFEKIGFNYKMTDLQAAVGIAQFKKLDRIIKRKTLLAKYWTKKLKDIKYIKSPYVREGDNNIHNYQGYTCLVDKNIDRNKLIQILREKGIQCQIGTYSSYIQPCYNNFYDGCEVSLDLYNRTIRLPLFYKLKKTDIDFIVLVLKDIEKLF